MNKNFTYQKRLKLILLIGGLFAIAIYKLSVADTFELLNKKNDLIQQVSNSNNAPEEIKTIKNRLQKIELLIGNDIDINIDVHQLLLESVTGYSQENNLILKEFPQPYLTSDRGYVTQTSIVTVEGGFIPLLKLSNYIENNYQGGKIVALDFKVTKELRTRKRKLISTIYLQNVKTDKNENNT